MAPTGPSPFARTLAAGGAALILGAAAAAGAAAQTATPSPVATSTATTAPATVTATTAAASATAAATATPSPQGTPGASPGRAGGELVQRYLDALARRLGVTTERLQQAVAEARAEAGFPTPGPNRPGAPGAPGAPGGPRWPGRPGPGGPAGPAVRLAFDVAAEKLGITPEQLRQELAGKSLADVARAHNADPATVAQAMKDDASRRIDEAAANGRLRAEQVAPLKERSWLEVDRFLDQTFPAPGQRPGRPGRPGRPAPAATPQSS